MYRIIDANLNRAREGLRVLEEIARFLLEDADLTLRFKGLRHDLGGLSTTLHLEARRAQEDSAAFLNPLTEMVRNDLTSLVMANAKRAEESLRVLEEFDKMQPVGKEGVFKRTRFELYQIEQELALRIVRKNRLGKIKGLYVIIDSGVAKGKEREIAQQVIEGGANVIQYRDKTREKGECLALVEDLRSRCAQAGVIFLINDHVDLALAVRADGVHLGQKDLPPTVARRMVPLSMIIGCSVATVEEALQAESESVDYLGVGSIFPTSTKADTRLAGLETLRAIRGAVALPLIAIGGINLSNVGEVMKAGADGVAVISAVVGAAQPLEATRQMIKAMEGSERDHG